MAKLRLFTLTTLTMIAFAGNSILCRVALKGLEIDAASFTTIRLISGAITLWIIVYLRRGLSGGRGNLWSALALFAYAGCFSYAYLSLSAGTGALILFGAVQLSMIGFGLWSGERLAKLQWTGFLLAFAGLVGLLLPGISAPPMQGSILMLLAGVAWGMYSLRGRGKGNPVRVSAGNFLLTIPFSLVLVLVGFSEIQLNAVGIGYAIASGAIASGLGYALWYSVLPSLRATSAATVQLSVPVIAALAGAMLLEETLTWRLVVSSLVILGGIALAIQSKGRTDKHA